VCVPFVVVGLRVFGLSFIVIGDSLLGGVCLWCSVNVGSVVFVGCACGSVYCVV